MKIPYHVRSFLLRLRVSKIFPEPPQQKRCLVQSWMRVYVEAIRQRLSLPVLQDWDPIATIERLPPPIILLLLQSVRTWTDILQRLTPATLEKIPADPWAEKILSTLKSESS
jgi:hypothetical protein